jgi:hypothetical protein
LGGRSTGVHSSKATKSGIAATLAGLAGFADAAAFPLPARAAWASPRFECQTASALPRLDAAVMNGFGALPLPAAI